MVAMATIQVYTDLIGQGVIHPFVEPPRPQIPIDYSWAQQLGLIRKPTSFVSTISDERGDELKYYNMPISQVIQVHAGVWGSG
jgi:ATP citrate (pro-S)-lyase